MGDDIGSGLSSMAVCFDFRSTVVQLSNQNPYFYQFRCHHPLITQLRRVYCWRLYGITFFSHALLSRYKLSLEPVIFSMLGVVYLGSDLKTYVHLDRNVSMTSQIIWPHCSKSYLVKVSKFQNAVYMTEILTPFGSYFGRNDKIINIF